MKTEVGFLVKPETFNNATNFDSLPLSTRIHKRKAVKQGSSDRHNIIVSIILAYM